MSQHLPHVIQNLFNTPLALSQAKGGVISSVLHGRLNIQELLMGNMRLDERGMSDLADMGRMGLVPGAPNGRNPENWIYGGRDYGSPNTDGRHREGRPYLLTESGIAVIRIQGTLTRTWGIGPFSGMTGYDGIWQQLLAAVDDRDVKGIWFDINSGGGAIDGLFDLTDGIFQLSRRSGGKKPFHAHAGDYAYSAAYAIMAACDKSTTPELGGVGSIGCIMMATDASEALSEAGIKVHIFRSGARKAIGVGGVEPLDQEEIDDIQAKIDKAGDFFCGRVAAYMPGLTKSAISQMQGRDYMGADAKAIGLVTDIASEQVAWGKLERAIAR